MYGTLPATTSGNSVPQKRILPSRSSRGGPVVGICETDIMILETKRRQFETEPLIPMATKFYLTTNTNVISLNSRACSAPSKLNLLANERYFDRPEVLKAFREQKIIETPNFVNMGGAPSASRLRARPHGGSLDDSPYETSDYVFEKRHRKYETFEKRQRLREKEKLKHEQYKLKERIDQLRVMDSAAFLALPASLFPVPPTKAIINSDFEQDDSDDQGTSTNSLSSIVDEGERRQKEMLDIAYMLEERYRTLLPRERGKKTIVSPVMEVHLQSALHDERERHESDEDEDEDDRDAQHDNVKVKSSKRTSHHTKNFYSHSRKGPENKYILLANRMTTPNPEESTPSKRVCLLEETVHSIGVVPSEEPDSGEENQMEPKSSSLEISPLETCMAFPNVEQNDLDAMDFTNIQESENREEGILTASPHFLNISSKGAIVSPHTLPISTLSSPNQHSSPSTPSPSPEITVLQSDSGWHVADTEDTQCLEVDHLNQPFKRTKTSAQRLTLSATDFWKDVSAPITSISVLSRRPRPPKQSVVYTTSSGSNERTCSALLISAIHSSGNSSRKGKRHLTAFGVKLQNELFDGHKDFNLPTWIHMPDDIVIP